MENALHNGQKQRLECALYVVATPIGNLRDISLRALDVLTSVDIVAAEDTRNTSHLLTHYSITVNRLLALHQHNERNSVQKIISLLMQGQSVALVTDAGTPAISDPGTLLVQAVREAGYRVIPIPGPNAALTALSASGLNQPHFLFYGFLPNKSAARCRELHTLASLPYILVFYEAPHRILECATDLLAILGNERQIVFARELTKMFESIHACNLGEAQDWLNSDSNNQRGEFVLLVSGANEQNTNINAAAERTLEILLEELPLKKAVQLAVQISGGNRNKLYQYALELKQQE